MILEPEVLSSGMSFGRMELRAGVELEVPAEVGCPPWRTKSI